VVLVLVHVLLVPAVVNMDGVEPEMSIVTLTKVVNPNLVNVTKPTDVVLVLVPVLMDTVVVNMDGVEPEMSIVKLAKDVNPNSVNVTNLQKHL